MTSKIIPAHMTKDRLQPQIDVRSLAAEFTGQFSDDEQLINQLSNGFQQQSELAGHQGTASVQTCRLKYKLAQLIDEKMLDAYLNDTDADYAFELCSELMSAKRDADK